ncbi:MAG: nitroreductase family protein [Nanoarchaeota archaeon]
MADFKDVVASRRSIHSYKDILVDKACLMNILQAACLAPSAGNIQNWRFILITEKEKISKVAHLCYGQAWMNEAPVVVVVCAESIQMKRFYGERGEHLYAMQSAAAATQNLLLAAEDQGVASCWVGAFDERRLSHMLNIPDTVRPLAVVTLGYSNEKRPMPQKQPLFRCVYLESYGNKFEDVNEVLWNYSKVAAKHGRRATNFFKDTLKKIKSLLKKD